MNKSIWILFAFLFIALDYVSKWLAQWFLVKWAYDLGIWAKLTLVYNTWIAFWLPISGTPQVLLSSILVVFMIYYAYSRWNLRKLVSGLTLGLIIWWAMWNLYERVLFWKVTDFISITSYFPTFNLADSFIFVWVMLVILIEKKFYKFQI